jgi:S-formylglutathione hydrolase FrmB
MLNHLRTLCVLALLAVLPGTLMAQGSLQQIKVHSPALAGNLEGDDPLRDVFVYLPPGYASSNKRYPVLYYLHGYAVGAEVYVNGVLRLPASVDEAMATGARDVIIVMPDAFTRYGGSMYSNSPTIGDWETFIAHDLVNHIDANYRTIASRESRGLSGHSMGGYGTMRIGMKHPEVFSALYAMSSCCLMNQAPGKEAVEAQLARMAEGLEIQPGTFNNAMQAQAAAWAPNPQNPPYYFDFPYNKEGEVQPLVQGKWTANSLLVTVDQNVPALKQYKAIMLDVGDKDGLEATNTQLVAAMQRLGIAAGYEIYDGDHGNRVGSRFIEKVLPFFEQHLAAQD